MKIWLVRNRNGEAVIWWPGVVRAAFTITLLYSVGVAVLSFALHWFSPLSFIGLPMLLSSILGIGVKQGLLLPPASLPTAG
jgi:hypothetical protein